MISAGMERNKIRDPLRFSADSRARPANGELTVCDVSWGESGSGCALVVIARGGDAGPSRRSWGTLMILQSGEINRFDAPVTVTQHPRVMAGSSEMLCFVFRLPRDAPDWPVERMLLLWQGHEIVLPLPVSGGEQLAGQADSVSLPKADLLRIERELAALQRALEQVIRSLPEPDSDGTASEPPTINPGAPSARSRRLPRRPALANGTLGGSQVFAPQAASDPGVERLTLAPPPASRMLVDIHEHLLPGIDDGPPDLRAALEMARAAVTAGIGTVALTPHVRFDFPDVHVEELSERCARLDHELRAAEIPLRVLPAAEVSLISALEADDEHLRMVSYNQRGRDLLIETPSDGLLLEQLLGFLLTRGMRVTLAHPERSRIFQVEPERLRDLQDQGVLVQVNASSLLRRRSDRIRRCAEYLCREDLAHVIASDGHRAESWRPVGSLAAAVGAATQLVGASRARWMTSVAPAAIIAGTALPPAPAIEFRPLPEYSSAVG